MGKKQSKTKLFPLNVGAEKRGRATAKEVAKAKKISRKKVAAKSPKPKRK